jgi:hypothetical protein
MDVAFFVFDLFDSLPAGGKKYFLTISFPFIKGYIFQEKISAKIPGRKLRILGQNDLLFAPKA